MIFTNEELKVIQDMLHVGYNMMHNERRQFTYLSWACLEQYDRDIEVTHALGEKVTDILEGKEYHDTTALKDVEVIVAIVTSGRTNAIPEQADQDLAQKILNMIENELLDADERKQSYPTANPASSEWSA